MLSQWWFIKHIVLLYCLTSNNLNINAHSIILPNPSHISSGYYGASNGEVKSGPSITSGLFIQSNVQHDKDQGQDRAATAPVISFVIPSYAGGITRIIDLNDTSLKVPTLSDKLSSSIDSFDTTTASDEAKPTENITISTFHELFHSARPVFSFTTKANRLNTTPLPLLSGNKTNTISQTTMTPEEMRKLLVLGHQKLPGYAVKSDGSIDSGIIHTFSHETTTPESLADTFPAIQTAVAQNSFLSSVLLEPTTTLAINKFTVKNRKDQASSASIEPENRKFIHTSDLPLSKQNIHSNDNPKVNTPSMKVAAPHENEQFQPERDQTLLPESTTLKTFAEQSKNIVANLSINPFIAPFIAPSDKISNISDRIQIVSLTTNDSEQHSNSTQTKTTTNQGDSSIENGLKFPTYKFDNVTIPNTLSPPATAPSQALHITTCRDQNRTEMASSIPSTDLPPVSPFNDLLPPPNSELPFEVSQNNSIKNSLPSNNNPFLPELDLSPLLPPFTLNISTIQSFPDQTQTSAPNSSQFKPNFPSIFNNDELRQNFFQAPITSKNYNKYTDGFGGAPGILSPNDN